MVTDKIIILKFYREGITKSIKVVKNIIFYFIDLSKIRYSVAYYTLKIMHSNTSFKLA